MTKKERELAIDIFEDNFTVIDTHGHYTEEEECLAIDMAIEALEQEPKTGHWFNSKVYDNFYICSKCGESGYNTFKYCPNCGAKMQKVKE